jgi:hypothetical protein
MENEQTNMPEQGCTKCGQKSCDGKSCGMCGGGWRHKNWKRHGGGRGGMCGGMWFIGWLFAIGFLKLAFWKGVLALVLWPYYLGAFFAR